MSLFIFSERHNNRCTLLFSSLAWVLWGRVYTIYKPPRWVTPPPPHPRLPHHCRIITYTGHQSLAPKWLCVFWEWVGGYTERRKTPREVSMVDIQAVSWRGGCSPIRRQLGLFQMYSLYSVLLHLQCSTNCLAKIVFLKWLWNSFARWRHCEGMRGDLCIFFLFSYAVTYLLTQV